MQISKINDLIGKIIPCSDLSSRNVPALSAKACPHHGFSELHQLDTFYNALNANDQDSLNSTAGGKFLGKMPRECLKIIESKSKVRQSRAKAVVAKVGTSSSTPAVSFDVAELKDLVRALLLDKKNQSSALVSSPTPAPVKAVEPNCVTCGGSRTLPSNTIINPKEELKGITTRSGVAYQGPTNSTPSKVVKQGTEVTKDQVQTPSSQSTAPVQPSVSQSETPTLIFVPVVAPVSALMPNVKSSIPYPSRRDNERRRMDECLALADLGASINLMPLSVWEALSLPELTPTCMTLELADRLVSKPIGIANDVSFKVGRCFLKTGRALIDVHKGELTLRIENEAITYNLDQTVRYSTNYNQITANKIDVICEEHFQEVLGFSDTTASGNPTPHDDLIISTTSLTLTPFRDSDFLLFEEADAFLGLEDDPDSPKISPFYYDPKGDILLLKTILNSKPLPPLPNHEQYLHSFKKELKVCEAKTDKSSVDEPPEVELKDLPPHLEYEFLEGDNKLPVIIARELGDEEKSALIKVLKSHKRAIAWKLSDIQGINAEFCTHKILMEEDYKPAVQHQRRVNPKIHDIIKKEVEKLLDAGFIYPISDSSWVSPEKTTFTCPYGTFAYRRMPFGLCNAPGTFRRCAVLGQRHEKLVKPIHYACKTMNDVKSNYTTTEKEMLAVVYAFEKFRSYLIMNKSIVHTDHSALKYLFAKKDAKARLLRCVLLLQEFDFKVLDTKGAEHLAADHLSRLENPYENVLDPKEINETFPLETLSMVTFCGDSSAPWFADFVNYHAGNFNVKGENQASWSDKLDDALWAFRTAYKTPIGCTPYKLVYGKAYHLLIELEHNAYWALKQTNFDLTVTVELSQANGPNFKVNVHRVKHYFGGDVPQLDYPNCKVFRTLVFHSQELHILSFNLGIQYLNLID
nr:reverse transcriptase domain-containing protein [Tanacetum cinerariifolium]